MKRGFIFLALVFLSTALSAQNYFLGNLFKARRSLSCDWLDTKHEFGIYGLGGVLSLPFDSKGITTMTNKKTSGYLGGGVGFSYTYFLDNPRQVIVNNRWAINAGVEIAFYGLTVDIDNIDRYTSLDYVDVKQQAIFQRHEIHDNFHESKRATYVNVPIMLTYLRPAFTNHKFYVSGGVKVGALMSGTFVKKSDKMVVYGHFPKTQTTLPDHIGDDMKDIGIGTWDGGISDDGKLPFDINTALAFETGFRWRNVNPPVWYTGVYADYGTSKIWTAGLKFKVTFW